jgi:hypothetical protein
MFNMTNQKILIKKLYNSLIKDNKVDISPLTYISEYDDNKNEIRIFISNPKNISYNTYVIEEFFNDKVTFFTEFIPSNIGPGPSSYWELKQRIKFYFDDSIKGDLYLNDKDKESLSNLTSNVTKFYFKDFKSDIKSKFNGILTDGDGNHIDITIQFLNPYYDNELIESEDNLEDVLQSMVEDDYFMDFTHRIYDDVLTYVWDDKFMTNTDYMYVDFRIDYRDPNGKNIIY